MEVIMITLLQKVLMRILVQFTVLVAGHKIMNKALGLLSRKDRGEAY